MTRNGIPIERALLFKSIRTGIDINPIPGQVPIFYELAACKEYNYRYFDDWQKLTPDQQATIIAHYLVTRLIESHTRDAETKELSKKNG